MLLQIGLVSEEKLIDLLEIALSSNTKKTMKRCRELLSSGVDPVAIMCQLAGLIVDILTGAYQLSSLQTCQNTAACQSCEFLSFMFILSWIISNLEVKRMLYEIIKVACFRITVHETRLLLIIEGM